MAHIFIRHSRKDVDFTRELAGALSNTGVSWSPSQAYITINIPN